MDPPPKIRKSVQSSLFGAVSSVAREFFYVQKEVLLTDEIYSGHVPNDMRGMFFCYMVTGYNDGKWISVSERSLPSCSTNNTATCYL